MRILFKHFFVLIALFITLPSMATAPSSFEEAKKVASRIFRKTPVTLYCSCTYNKSNKINLASCNMQSASSHKSARQLEWEHMMPAEFFGIQFPCWTQPLCERNGSHFKGRECCEMIDANFRLAEAELYNLWPAVGLVNIERSNYAYGILPTHNGFYGCDFEINTGLKIVEPADHAKGIVARATLFMADKQNVPLTTAQRQLYEAWSKEFPPTSWERVWAAKVAAIEGYANPYIDNS